MCALNKQRDSHEIKTNGSQHNGHINDFNFEINNDDLSSLMKLRGLEAIERIEHVYGGINGLANKLHTNLMSGLNASDKKDIKKRIDTFGKNEIPPKRPKLFIQLVFDALKDTTLVILIICAFVSIGLSFYHPPEEAIAEEAFVHKEKNLEWIEGAAIFIAVVVVVFVTAFNDWRKEKQFRGLQDRIEKESTTSVVRNGQVEHINIKDLVVGDLCCIKYGDLLPADGILVHSNDLKIDESSLTGETDLVNKNENDVILLSGTHVMEGSGKYMITAVGLNSQTGIIFSLLGATKEKKTKKIFKKDDKKVYNNVDTHEESIDRESTSRKSSKTSDKQQIKSKTRSVLQTKLNKLAIQIGYVGILSALLTFIILCIRMSVDEFVIKKHIWSNSYIKYIISYLIQAVTVIVVAVPEGLPLAVTLSLAYAVRQMTTDNNLVRHLDACETMGSATTICSDKTGTLTTNRMTVVQCYFGNEIIKKIPFNQHLNAEFKSLLFEAVAINTNYTSIIEPPKQLGELPKQLGNKTECALLGFVMTLGGNYDSIRNNYPSESFVKVYTFNSARKMMSTIIKRANIDEYRVYTKGAPEVVLERCSFIINSDGKIETLNEFSKKHIIQGIVESMAVDGLRTLCVAYKDFVSKNKKSDKNESNAEYFDETPDWNNEEDIIGCLTCICIVGIEDPVRDEVPDAITKCQKSGVVVRMITGDNINTATSIALKCGIIHPGHNFLVLESKDFNNKIRDASNQVSQDLLDQVWPRLRVLARSSPEDKYILVNGIVNSKLSANREVVAVTGDGTNDGPALKRADVGFAMGIQGTDVAKEASDIILTDDNFSSIVKAMMWGRNVHDSIAKFLQFQLTANFVAALLSIVCAATIKAVPLKAVQMLWVNLVMDTLASLALSTEQPTASLLERKPYGRTKPIISVSMLKSIIAHGIYQLTVIIVLVWFAEDWMLIENVVKYDDINKLRAPSQHFTLIFNAFVMMTLFNEINARKIHGERNVFDGIFRNPYFYIIWIICFAGQILIVNFGGIAFSVERLDFDHWLWCLAFGIGSLLWGQLVILIPKRVVKRILCMREKPPVIHEIPMVPIELDLIDELSKSKVLWLHGITRIQQQLKVVAAFKSRLEELSEGRSHYGSVISLRDTPIKIA